MTYVHTSAYRQDEAFNSNDMRSRWSAEDDLYLRDLFERFGDALEDRVLLLFLDFCLDLDSVKRLLWVLYIK